MNKFDRKGYGRIYVLREEDIPRVKEIIKEMDEFEYGYLPDDLIARFDSMNVNTTYTYKFDNLDLNELQIRCWQSGILCFVLNGSLLYEIH